MNRHFYHVWVDGAWTEPATEHAEALSSAGFTGHITVSLVGEPARRAHARHILGRLLARLPDSPVDWVEHDRGHEQVTLETLRAWLAASNDDGPVLYAHTKGAYHHGHLNTAWRQSMTRHVVGEWRKCVGLLADGYDTVGCHWLTPDVYPHVVGSPFYGGNFWWATADYLRRLPSVGNATRFDAEGWIGLGDPHAYDLLPGWPSEGLFP